MHVLMTNFDGSLNETVVAESGMSSDQDYRPSGGSRFR